MRVDDRGRGPRERRYLRRKSGEDGDQHKPRETHSGTSESTGRAVFQTPAQLLVGGFAKISLVSVDLLPCTSFIRESLIDCIGSLLYQRKPLLQPFTRSSMLEPGGAAVDPTAVRAAYPVVLITPVPVIAPLAHLGRRAYQPASFVKMLRCPNCFRVC